MNTDIDPPLIAHCDPPIIAHWFPFLGGARNKKEEPRGGGGSGHKNGMRAEENSNDDDDGGGSYSHLICPPKEGNSSPAFALARHPPLMEKKKMRTNVDRRRMTATVPTAADNFLQVKRPREGKKKKNHSCQLPHQVVAVCGGGDDYHHDEGVRTEKNWFYSINDNDVFSDVHFGEINCDGACDLDEDEGEEKEEGRSKNQNNTIKFCAAATEPTSKSHEKESSFTISREHKNDSLTGNTNYPILQSCAAANEPASESSGGRISFYYERKYSCAQKNRQKQRSFYYKS
jgi:hypothetical protein